MVFCGSTRQIRIQCFSYQCKRWFSQFYGINLISDVAWRRIGIIGSGRTCGQFAFRRSFAAPLQVSKLKPDVKDSKGPRLNKAITSQYVRLVTDEGHDIVSIHEALVRAMKLKLDLVEVQRNANPPVCKIMDFHREIYKQQIKEKERSKSKSALTLRKGNCKEVRFTRKTEQKDLEMKANMVKRLMERGYRVKCMAMGTEEEDLGGLLSRLSVLIEDVAFIESGPRVEKRQAFAVVRHIKFGTVKKSPVKKTAAVPPMSSKTGSAEIPQPEDGWAHGDSVSDTEEEIHSDEDAQNYSDTPISSPIGGPKEDYGEKAPLSFVNADRNLDEVFRFDGNNHNSHLMSGDKTIVNREKPFGRLVKGFEPYKPSSVPISASQNVNQPVNSKMEKIAGPFGFGHEQKAGGFMRDRFPLHLNRTNANEDSRRDSKANVGQKTFGFGHEQKAGGFMRDRFPLHLNRTNANEDSRRDSKEFVGQKQSIGGIYGVADSRVPATASEFPPAFRRSQTNGRDLPLNNLPEPSNGSQSPKWQPLPPVKATPSTTRSPLSTDDSAPGKTKSPAIDDSRSRTHMDRQQGPSLSSFGIFSAPKTAAPNDQTTSKEVLKGKQSNPTQPTNSPGSDETISNLGQPKQTAGNRGQESNVARQGKWGVFGRDIGVGKVK